MNERTSALRGLLERIRANPGDYQAINELMTAAVGRIRRLAATIIHGSFKTLREQGACMTTDVTQEALYRVWKPLAADKVNDVDHLFRLAANCIRSHLIDLSRKKQPLYFDDVDVKDVEAGKRLVTCGDDETDYAAFYDAIEQLPEHQRQVLEYSEFHGLETDEIASLLKTEKYTIRRLKTRALINLKKALCGPLSHKDSTS